MNTILIVAVSIIIIGIYIYFRFFQKKKKYNDMSSVRIFSIVLNLFFTNFWKKKFQKILWFSRKLE